MNTNTHAANPTHVQNTADLTEGGYSQHPPFQRKHLTSYNVLNYGIKYKGKRTLKKQRELTVSLIIEYTCTQQFLVKFFKIRGPVSRGVFVFDHNETSASKRKSSFVDSQLASPLQK